MTIYSIKDLEYLSGIKAHTIRMWEKRYQLLEPDRSDTNIRSYSDEDVRKILNVAMLVKRGYKISNVAQFDTEKLQSEVIRINTNVHDSNIYTDQLLFQTVNLNVDGFEQILDKIIEEYGFEKTIQHVVFPYFERIGILWQAGSIFAAHEHFVSNIIRNRLIMETAKFKTSESASSALFFLHENEWHEIGLLFSCYLATKAGLKCIYLGQSLPFADLTNLVVNNRFDFICTSFIQAVEKTELELYLANLSLLFNQTKILVAGRQISLHKPKIPSNVLVIKSYSDFLKRISD